MSGVSKRADGPHTRSHLLSFDAFKIRYSQHMSDVIPILKQYNCVRYSVQLNSNETQSSALAAMGVSDAAGGPPYDAVTILAFPNLEDFKGFMGDANHHDLLKRDADMCENDKTVIVSGEVVDGI